MELSKTIKRLRAEHGWSQENLAERAYVSRQTVSNWENEKSYPDVHSLLILSDLFCVSLDELIKGDVDTMKNTIQNTDGKQLNRLQLLGVLQFFSLIFGITLLVEYGGEIGIILGAMLGGALAVGIFLTFRKMEQIKQENDIQTYREVLAFINGETLDDIEKANEQKKRVSMRNFEIAAAVVSGAMLIFAAVVAIMQFVG